MDENRTDAVTGTDRVVADDQPAVTTATETGTDAADTTVTDQPAVTTTDDEVPFYAQPVPVATGTFADLTNDAWVYVAVQGKDDYKVDYRPGLTAGEAVRIVAQWSGVTLRDNDGRVLTVNGLPVKPDYVLNPNSVVIVTGRVRNG